MARATDSPSDAFPTLRPDEGEDGARASPGGLTVSPLGSTLPNGQVLDDALLHVVEARVVRAEDLLRGGDVHVVPDADAPRDLGDGVEPGADPSVLDVLLGRPLQPVDLPKDRLANRLRHPFDSALSR